MRLTSHGTGGARRRRYRVGFRRRRTAGRKQREGWEYEPALHRPLAYRGLSLGELVFEAHGDDGRTYTLKLNDADVAEVLRAAEAKLERERKRTAGDDYRERCELERAGQER